MPKAFADLYESVIGRERAGIVLALIIVPNPKKPIFVGEGRNIDSFVPRARKPLDVQVLILEEMYPFVNE